MKSPFAGLKMLRWPRLGLRLPTWPRWRKRGRRMSLLPAVALPGPAHLSRSDGPRQPWRPGRMFLALKVLAAVTLTAGAVLGWRTMERRLEARVSQTAAVKISAERVQLVDAPKWMSQALQKHLQGLVASHVSADPLDSASLEVAVQTLAASPWVEGVSRIQRLKQAVMVSATYREPVALVQVADGYRIVDAKGVCLPGVFQNQHLAKLRLPVIVGVSAKAPAEGRPWPGEEVQAGYALAKLLAKQPFASQIQAVDVSARDVRGRLRMSLMTRDGLVRWGLPPGQEQAIEPTAQTKIDWLTGLYKKVGSIDGGGRVIDVFGPAVYFHDQLPTPGNPVSPGLAGGGTPGNPTAPRNGAAARSTAGTPAIPAAPGTAGITWPSMARRQDRTVPAGYTWVR
jgi:hypothetical protein